MSLFREWNINQELILPPNMEDWLEPGHMAIWFRDLVFELTRRDLPHWRDERVGGRPAYHPSMMVAVLIFSYIRGIRSSRRIARLMLENIAFKVISGDQSPNFRTLCEFRRAHHAWLQRVFTRVILLAWELKLVDLGAVLVDGSVFQASASKKHSRRRRSLRALERVEIEARAERIGEAAERLAERLLSEAECADVDEDGIYGDEGYPDPLFAVEALPSERLERIQMALRAVERRERVRATAKARRQAVLMRLALARKARHPKKRTRRNPGVIRMKGLDGLLARLTQVKVPRQPRANTTDPESRRLRQSQTGGFVQGQQMLRATDANSGIILDVQAVTGLGESRALPGLVDRVLRRLGIPALMRLVADKGFAGAPNLKALDERKVRETVIPQLRTSKKGARVREAKTLCAKRSYWMKKRRRIEAGFGHTKANKGLRQLLLRGKRGAEIEWLLDAIGGNLEKIFLKFQTIPGNKLKRSLDLAAQIGF